jgi:hypothetical protein
MPVALSELVIWIVPALLTLLLLSIVTAVPLVTVTDPAEVMLTSDGAPLLAVDVFTGVVIAVEIELCAAAGVAANRMTGVRQVEASNTRI